MAEPRAYFNGRFVPLSSVAIPLTDTGFVQGVTVAEQLRTFRGRLFRLPQHLARLRRSLAIIGLESLVNLDELGSVAEQLAAENHARLDPDDDLGLTILVTPGPYAYPTAASEPQPLVCVYTRPLPFRHWADLYEQGDRLIVTSVRQVSPRCWPPELKVRSRVHYYLADREARARQRGARALLLDDDGHVCEATTANVVAYFVGEGLVSPRHEKILPGISVAALADLCRELSVPFVERDLSPEELRRGDELLLCSTSPCVWPVVELDGARIGSGRPGAMLGRLLGAWSAQVGVDIAAQARRFAGR